jgi:hypothetical protein
MWHKIAIRNLLLGLNLPWKLSIAHCGLANFFLTQSKKQGKKSKMGTNEQIFTFGS